jgi:hypothetical protein
MWQTTTIMAQIGGSQNHSRLILDRAHASLRDGRIGLVEEPARDVCGRNEVAEDDARLLLNSRAQTPRRSGGSFL